MNLEKKDSLTKRFQEIKADLESKKILFRKGPKHYAKEFINLGEEFMKYSCFAEADLCAEEANSQLELIKPSSNEYQEISTSYQKLINKIKNQKNGICQSKIRKPDEIMNIIHRIDFSLIESNDTTDKITKYLVDLSLAKPKDKESTIDDTLQSAIDITKLRKEANELYHRKKILEKELYSVKYDLDMVDERSLTKLMKNKTILMELVAENLTFRREIRSSFINKSI